MEKVQASNIDILTGREMFTGHMAERVVDEVDVRSQIHGFPILIVVN